jgi:hypothetical protein
MSTRSIIARSMGEGTFQGVYHHWDGYPTGLGNSLTEILVGPFAGDLPRMLHTLIDEHPAGWSTIVHKDFTLTPGYTWEKVKPPSCEGKSDAEYHAAMEAYRAKPDVRRPQCYCHGKRREQAQAFTEHDDTDAEWAYVFEEEERVLHVCHRAKHPDSGESYWNDVGRVELDNAGETNWTHIECGANYERCSHYAWFHFPELKGTALERLGTAKFLGREPMQRHDAIAYVLNGIRYQSTGCGFRGGYSGRANIPTAFRRFLHDSRYWFEEVIGPDGARIALPVSVSENNVERPCFEVSWVFPPTLDNQRPTTLK